jgi:hypothetical protein
MFVLRIPEASVSQSLVEQTSPPEDYWQAEYWMNSSWGQRVGMRGYEVSNDALVGIYCHLFSDSNNSITLLIVGENWNVSTILVEVNQTINMTVTNGVVFTNSYDDTVRIFGLDVLRGNDSDVGHVLLAVTLWTRGWYPSPWPLIPSVAALLMTRFIWSKRHRKTRKKRNN